MPRGPISGATAALIQALAALGVHVSRYQIERWRAAGDLPRPVRHGLGRGRGVVSDAPDDTTVQTAISLARASQRGRRRPGTHVLERFAAGRPVDETVVRQAFTAAVDRAARSTGAGHGDGHEDTERAWQIRQDRAGKVGRHDLTPVRWQDLADAVGEQALRPEPSRAVMRAAAAGLVHVTADSEAAHPDDVIALLGVMYDLNPTQLDELRHAQHIAELAGEDLLGPVTQILSVAALRSTAQHADLDQLRRAVATVGLVNALQTFISSTGILDLAGNRPPLPETLSRFNGATFRAVQADPMWPIANHLILRPRRYVQQLALAALLLVRSAQLEIWEAYRDRLLQLTGHEPSPAAPISTGPS